jgi:hypothetical protein
MPLTLNHGEDGGDQNQDKQKTHQTPSLSPGVTYTNGTQTKRAGTRPAQMVVCLGERAPVMPAGAQCWPGRLLFRSVGAASAGRRLGALGRGLLHQTLLAALIELVLRDFAVTIGVDHAEIDDEGGPALSSDSTSPCRSVRLHTASHLASSRIRTGASRRVAARGRGRYGGAATGERKAGAQYQRQGSKCWAFHRESSC